MPVTRRRPARSASLRAVGLPRRPGDSPGDLLQGSGRPPLALASPRVTSPAESGGPTESHGSSFTDSRIVRPRVPAGPTAAASGSGCHRVRLAQAQVRPSCPFGPRLRVVYLPDSTGTWFSFFVARLEARRVDEDTGPGARVPGGGGDTGEGSDGEAVRGWSPYGSQTRALPGARGFREHDKTGLESPSEGRGRAGTSFSVLTESCSASGPSRSRPSVSATTPWGPAVVRRGARASAGCGVPSVCGLSEPEFSPWGSRPARGRVREPPAGPRGRAEAERGTCEGPACPGRSRGCRQGWRQGVAYGTPWPSGTQDVWRGCSSLPSGGLGRAQGVPAPWARSVLCRGA